MKIKSNNLPPNAVISIYANDKIGLLGQILNILNRPYHRIFSLNTSVTDIENILLITIEVGLPEQQLFTILRKIEKIIDVYKATGYSNHEAEIKKIGFFNYSMKGNDTNLNTLLLSHGASISKVLVESIIIQKIASSENLKKLYNDLEGEHLISFCESLLVVERSLGTFNDALQIEFTSPKG